MLVFTYGTLKKGHGNHRLLTGSHFVSEAETRHRFKMYDVVGFPVLIGPTVDGHRVRGEVYLVDDKTMAQLDRLESAGRVYDRKRCYVTLDNGERHRVNIYVGVPSFWHDRQQGWRPVAALNDVYDWQRVRYYETRHAGEEPDFQTRSVSFSATCST